MIFIPEYPYFRAQSISEKENRIQTMRKLRITAETAYDWMIVTFLARDTLDTFFQAVLTPAGLNHLAGALSTALIFLPVLLASALNIGRMKTVVPFVALYILLRIVFAVNLSLHPDYQQYYTRQTYGAYEVFFGVSRGAIFGFLVFSLAGRTKSILSDIHISAVLLLVYCLYRFYKASKLGYWEEYNDIGVLVKQRYNLVFGYKTMLCCIIFLFFFLEKRNILDLAGAGVSLLMEIRAGSRGPLICLVFFVVLYLFLRARKLKMRYKVTISAVLLGAYYAISRYLDRIMAFGISILQKLHITSRTVDMLLNGEITDDHGRAEIARLSWDGIAKQGFFGMGPFGCRTIIAPYFNYGYPHNIFLEFILDYGWVLGVLFLSILAIMILKVFRNRDREQTAVTMILLAMCVKLAISGSYWSEPLFWGILGWTVSCLWAQKRRKKDVISELILKPTMKVRYE